MTVRIIAVRKDRGNHDNPHEAVSDYKWLNEQDNNSDIEPRANMVSWVEKGGKAYVKDAAGTVYCYVNVSRAGTKFLQTYADNRWSDNLLSLPEC